MAKKKGQGGKMPLPTSGNPPAGKPKKGKKAKGKKR